MYKSKRQMSETYINAIFLTLSGGFQDAYTYFSRGGVFANAQTGNIVLMSEGVFKGDVYNVIRYLLPVCAFIVGIFLAEVVRRHFRDMKKVHWRQLILIFEICLLFASGFIPNKYDIPANIIISFVCALQVQSFRKIDGMAYASTMCIGNMRSATEALCTYVHTKNKSTLIGSAKYFGIIFLFALGAGAGSVFTNILGIRAIWISCILLLISFAIMAIEEEKRED